MLDLVAEVFAGESIRGNRALAQDPWHKDRVIWPSAGVACRCNLAVRCVSWAWRGEEWRRTARSTWRVERTEFKTEWKPPTWCVHRLDWMVRTEEMIESWCTNWSTETVHNRDLANVFCSLMKLWTSHVVLHGDMVSLNVYGINPQAHGYTIVAFHPESIWVSLFIFSCRMTLRKRVY
jgi:hypothetical protein